MKAQGYLERNNTTAKAISNASKSKIDKDGALKLARKAKRVVAVRGKSVVEFDMRKDAPDDETLLVHLLGRTGNLRAPCLLHRGVLYVGFGEAAYEELFKKP